MKFWILNPNKCSNFFLQKYSKIFQISLLTSLIDTMKHHKNFLNFWTSRDMWNIKKDMSKILKNKNK